MSNWLNRLVARPDVQDRLARWPVTRGFVRRDGAEIFDIMQGFVRAQVLYALVSLDLITRLARAPATPADLAREAGMTPRRMEILLRAGTAIGILKLDRQGRARLSRKGAALSGVEGLSDLILHHRAFYADMADPVALLRGEAETELAAFWPYVFGAGAAEDAETAGRYSDLMARTQRLVAADTLDAVSLNGVGALLDVGGGSGAFLAAVAARWPEIQLHLLDLPAVLPLAEARMADEGLTARFTAHPGSFRDAALPEKADAISLIRVLYDHDDDTVRDLLAKAHAALPAGGRLVISEPMSGGARPDPATDVYFAFYTLAMMTGRARSQDEIATMCRTAGFTDIRTPRPRRSFVTSVVTAVK